MLNPTVQKIISNDIHQDIEFKKISFEKNKNKTLSPFNSFNANKKLVNSDSMHLNDNTENVEFEANKIEIDENNKNFNSKKDSEENLNEHQNNQNNIIKLKSNLEKREVLPEWKKLQKIINEKYKTQLNR